MVTSSVIILVVDEHCVFAFKCKRKPPILIYPYSPASLLITLQRMQSPVRDSHIIWTACRIEPTELKPQPLRMLRLDAGLRARAKERLEPGMAKGADHQPNCIVILYAMQ